MKNIDLKQIGLQKLTTVEQRETEGGTIPDCAWDDAFPNSGGGDGDGGGSSWASYWAMLVYAMQ